MAVTKKVPTFETADGKEFESLEAAERHDKFIETKKRYDAARHEYARLLLESQKTADGVPFKLGGIGSYYYIAPNYAGFPRLGQINFLGWGFDFDENDAMIIRQKDDNGDWVSYSIDELYYFKENANKALLAAKKERLEDFEAEVNELRIEIEKGK